VVVVLFHDHGSRYVGKMFNDEWMRERGFIEDDAQTAADLIQLPENKTLVSVKTEELVSHAIERMKAYKISQIPVEDSTGFVGSIDEADLLRKFIENKDISDLPIKEVMNKPFPIVEKQTSIEVISKLFNRDNNAVLVKLDNGMYQIITKYDIISAL
jgi:cystathionine beta-synthase